LAGTLDQPPTHTPEQLLLLLQRVEHGDRGGLLQAVCLEGRQHVDELQKDLSDVGTQQIFISLGSKVNVQLMKYIWMN